MATTQHRVLEVTAADYNGKDFDGSPVKTLFPMEEGKTIKDVCPWFVEAIEKGQILIEARGSTDYAWFGVKTDCNNVHWAGPGDLIMYNRGYIVVVPSCIAKYIEREFKALDIAPGLGRNIRLEANAMQFHGEYRPLSLGD